MTYDNRQFYIDGAWVDPVDAKEFQVINPATETVAGVISMGSAKDVDRAVAAARRAFDGYSRTSPAERLALMERILAAYKAHYDEIAQAISTEMGAPITLAKGSQTRIGVGHISAMIEVLKTFKFEEMRGTVRLMHEAGVPAGVFNLINGDGATIGGPLSSHKDIDMVSFTGSTRAGTEVARSAAASVKRVHQELGGKSPNVLLDDADFERAVKQSVLHVFQNSGQSCNAPTRMLVPESKMAAVEAIAKRIAETAVVVGDPASDKTTVGPLVSKLQFQRVEGYIEKGIAEGAHLVTGGLGRPEGLSKGYFVKPTIFSNVRNDMTIAREEIFGPVLCILPYRTEEEAVQIANDTPYGLAAYVWSQDNVRARRVGNRIRAGQVALNGAYGDMQTPFGGFKMSGNGREYGEFGLRDFLEVKAMIGVDAA